MTYNPDQKKCRHCKAAWGGAGRTCGSYALPKFVWEVKKHVL